MKKILLTFAGNTDCKNIETGEGPILDILKELYFDKLYILYDQVHYVRCASKIKQFCEKKYPGLVVCYQVAMVANPTDYNLVYPAMVGAVKNILREEQGEEVSWTISVTSGTPVMHACWVLLVQGGVLDARLIQSSREEGVKVISFSLDDFPTITTPRQNKVLLTLAERENKVLRGRLGKGWEELIGEDPSVLEAKKKLTLYSEYDLPVFIHGESGTGKEVAANLLHINSPRRNGPFIAVNCGTISETLFESEFFGHKKGSFTGSSTDRDGFFVQADKGTIFLDEIGDLAPSNQVKFLRVLDQMTIRPLGGKERKVDVRIVTASHRDLEEMKDTGSFREDLYYRLVQLEVGLPPLRDRGADIILLARHFLDAYGSRYKRSKAFSPAGEKKLLEHKYPGNVRELQKIVRLAYINSTGDTIGPEDILLPATAGRELKVEIPEKGIDLMNEVIPAYMRAALAKTGDNAAAAARLLGMKPHTFRARLRKLIEKVK